MNAASPVLPRCQGCPVLPSTLHEWTRYAGGEPVGRDRWVYEPLPAGAWELSPWRWQGGGAALGPCQGSYLPPGGTPSVRLPAFESQS
ncbi:MAG: hypothetical protein NZ869_08975 [Thermoanaerobaculum sp.]|nr:hypothetical protein [Thermoanaerobaculum sp.]MDW7968371.1 hypothetical protein [Thermoanaerobaculum sp.]